MEGTVEGTLSALGVLGKALGITAIAMVVLIICFVVFMDIWSRYATRGRIYAYFFEHRNFSPRLLREDISANCVWLGIGENKEKYLLDDAKQFWTMWPPGIPRFIQVPIRAHIYVRNQMEPLDPSNTTSSLTAKAFRMVTDEAMLKQAWKDVRESLGVRTGKFPLTPGLFLSILVLLIVGFNAYLTYNQQIMLESVVDLIGG